ncbi:unnamed protein product [Ilex paraguariensis]|uniref:PRKR-interacting protein 1 n=1 Tax=Ilex paraguariensis TaxID=185542 RepID=A0ABC8UJF6_9AQUA
MSSGGPSTAGDEYLQVVPVAALPPRPPAATSTVIVKYTPSAPNLEEEDLEVKLRRILECVPVRVNNTSGSSAGSGSVDIHQVLYQDYVYMFGNPQESFFFKFCRVPRDSEVALCQNKLYRQMRRKEQDRLARMDIDYQKRKELAEFSLRREERLRDAEEQTAKKRLKRQTKKQRKKVKKSKLNAGEEEHQKKVSSEDDEKSDNDKAEKQMAFD